MDFFQFFGDFLSKIINKELRPSTGLLRLAFKLDFPDKDPKTATYKDISFMFKNGMKKKLEILEVDNISNVINQMVRYLTLNQSLLTISK